MHACSFPERHESPESRFRNLAVLIGADVGDLNLSIDTHFGNRRTQIRLVFTFITGSSSRMLRKGSRRWLNFDEKSSRSSAALKRSNRESRASLRASLLAGGQISTCVMSHIIDYDCRSITTIALLKSVASQYSFATASPPSRTSLEPSTNTNLPCE